MKGIDQRKRFSQWIGTLPWLGARSGSWTVPLAELNGTQVGEAGSKAVTLGRLLRAGLPVPPGFVITGDAFRRFLNCAARGQEAQTALARRAEAPLKEVAESSRQCEQALAESPIPVPVERAVQEALGKLPGVRSWAVRSSATLEDLPQASFAGQYESFLNVPNDDVLDKVRRCWRSLFSLRAVAYRARRPLPRQEVLMAVIVQRMIPAEKAGVMFTVDSISRDSGRVVIEGSRGLGDRVVSGHVTPERVVISRASFEVLERTPPRAPEGDPVAGRENLPSASGDVSGADDTILNDQCARRLAELGLQVEQILGGPQDIEWAEAGGEFYLLQARPATAGPPGKSWEDRQVWTNLNTGEVLPDVTTPITWSLLQRFLDPAFRSVLRLQGADIGASPVAGLVAGRVYFNANTGLAAIKPFSFMLTRIPNLAQALGGGQVEVSPQRRRGIPDADLPDLGFRWRRYILSWPRLVLDLVRHSPRRGDAWTAGLKAQVDQLVRVEIETMSTVQLTQFFTRQVEQGFDRWDLLNLLTQAASLPVFQLVCHKWLNDPELTLGYRLFSGLGGVAEAEAGLALWRLAVLGHGDQATEAALAGGTWVDVRRKLQGTDHGQQFLEAWRAFMAEHGHHCRGELELHNPRWSDMPDYILGVVRGYLSSIERLNPVANHERLAEERRQLTEQCRRRLKHPLKRWLFSRSLRRAQKLAINREEWKNQAVRQMAFLRRVLLELGRRLHQNGALADPDDIFFLEFSEIEPVAVGRVCFDARGRIRSRRTEYRSNLEVKPPPIVWGRFVPKAATVAKANLDAKVLEGIPVSPGRVTGRAKLIHRSDDHDQVLPGEILIAAFTDPAWTPYFVAAAGVVTDQGGILSHGSIVAREYGLPAVTNLGSATQVIRNGDLIEVDGNRGRVTILERGEAAS